jgi:8-oxo-dGTP diphosphatase
MTPENDEQGESRTYPEHPLVGVGAVIVKDGKFLLVKRAFEPSAGKWSVPGGLVEVGESLAEACIRETEEETGLKVEVLELINVFDMIDRDDAGRVRYHYVLIDFLVKPVGGEEKPSHESTDMRWVSRDDMRQMDMTRTARRAIEELFGGASR